MTRFYGTPDSVFQGAASFLAEGQLKGFITGNVKAGELCTLFESGVIMRTDPTLSWDDINRNDVGPDQVLPPEPSPDIDFTAITVQQACGVPVLIKDFDYYVVPIQTPNGVGFCIRNSSGLTIKQFVQCSSDTSTVNPYCQEVTGGFMLFWHVSASLKSIFVSLPGCVVGSVVIPSTIVATSGAYPWHCRNRRGTGKQCHATFADTNGHLRIQLFNDDGSLSGSLLDVDSSCHGTNFVSAYCEFGGLDGTSVGDFLVGTFDTGSNHFKLYRFSATGTKIWGPFTPTWAASAPFGDPDISRAHRQENRLIELVNGNIAWVLPDVSGGTSVFLCQFDGTFLQQIQLDENYRDPDFEYPICKTPWGFAIAHCVSDGPETYATFYDAGGNCTVRNAKIDDGSIQFPTGSSPVCNLYTDWAGTGLAVCRHSKFGGTTEGRIFYCDNNGNRIGEAQELQPPTSSDCDDFSPICDLDGTAFVSFFAGGTSQLTVCQHRAGRSSVIGVAQADATNGQAVTIVAEGYFQLPSTQVFGPGHAFDQRNAPIVGCRGTVGGQVAVLFGWL